MSSRLTVNFFRLLCLTFSFCLVGFGLIAEEEKEEEETFSEDQIFRIVLEPNKKSVLSSQIPSPVITILKNMGDSFKENEILIQLDDIAYLAAYEEAKSIMKKNEVELDAKRTLFEHKNISFSELRTAEADLATAIARLALAKKNLEGTKIKAPYDGKVADIKIELGEIPQPGQELLTIINDRILIGKMLLSSSLLKNMQKGSIIRFTILETGENAEARIIRISPLIDAASSTVKVEFELDNSNGSLTPGMSGVTTIKDESKEEVKDDKSN